MTFYIFVVSWDRDFKFDMLVNGSKWQTIPERGVVWSREPFTFRWAPTISVVMSIVSGAVNLGGWSVWWTGDRRRSLVYYTDRQHLCTACWREAPRRTGLSAAMTCLTLIGTPYATVSAEMAIFMGHIVINKASILVVVINVMATVKF